ncbi:helix-turn-helix transcriptional regulator [Pseudonocardia thermophila]|uniref:helix-turn-helix transcriptional regulator n=1 Tax=Pseudonocardia thermophila TaxID=1848 RepID=UPI00248E3975|nr:LuxR C-terminal-related transcriptional regulator [Pseudonocardia thermophila]
MELVNADGEWLELTAAILARPIRRLPVERIALQLIATFSAAGCAFAQFLGSEDQVDGSIYPLSEPFGGLRARIDTLGPTAVSALHPVVLQCKAVGRFMLTQSADVPHRFVDRRTREQWRTLSAPGGVDNQLCIPLGRALTSTTFGIGRNRPFSAKEMALASRINQLLIGLQRQADALSNTTTPALDAANDIGLTPRELAVVTLLADGLTAAAIARRLTISDRTVHKHLQHIYAKLGVQDRLSAVLVAERHGALQLP